MPIQQQSSKKLNQFNLTKQIFVHPIVILHKQQQKSRIQQIHQNQKCQQLVVLSKTYKKQIKNFNEQLLETVENSDNEVKALGRTKNISKTKNFPSLSSQGALNSKIQFYRTRMCPDGRQCKKRLVCNFAHNQYQLRRPYRNRKNPCIRYQKGLCSMGAACPDYHGNMDLKKKNYKYKSQTCKQWQQKGQCSKGKLCIFIHNQKIADQNDQISCQSIIEQNQGNRQQGQDQVNQLLQLNEKKQGNFAVIQSNQSHALDLRNSQQAKQQKTKMGNIFNQTKKSITAVQIVEEKIKQTEQEKQQNLDQGFNIQFNF